MASEKNGNGHLACDICKHHFDFEMPEDVLDAARHQRLVIFAGAGVSTEVPAVLPYTFYDEIASEMAIDSASAGPSFPDLMTDYCLQPNGRRKLLKRLKQRFDFIDSFPALLNAATRFHEELSTIPHLDDIVTTNWDAYFERFCGATPFVSPQDFVFWDMPGRKVFKIHGSIDSYSSIIATNDDYDRCHDQLSKGIVGSNLKMMLATKVVVFVGYSLRDHDFSRIYEYLRSEMKDVLPHAYAIAISPESAERFRRMGLTPIVTDGTFFLKSLKSHLISEHRMVPDDRFGGVLSAWTALQHAHVTLHKLFSYEANPELVHCASYQDGMMDAFGRIGQRRCSGEYSCRDHVINKIEAYMDAQSKARSKRRYIDVAYIDGYINALCYLIANDEDRRHIPFYFLHGSDRDLITLEQYQKRSRRAAKLHNASFKQAAKIAKLLGPGMVFHHRPMI